LICSASAMWKSSTAMRGVGSAARGAALVPRPAAAAADIRHGPELRRQPAATVAAPSAAATATAASRCRPKQPERRTCAPRASSVAGSNGSAQHPASSPRDAASETRATASVAPANADIKQALPREEPKEGRAPTTATLLLQCPDQRGVVASTAQLLYGFGMNIISSDQFSDTDENQFFQRVVFDYSESIVGPGNTVVLERAIAELARRFDMDWRISYKQQAKRMAILVSKQDHCLYDILIRLKSNELSNCEIPVIISNHPDLESVAKMFGVPFRCLPIAEKGQKQLQEEALERILEEYNIDFLVLARYMQIFSKEFCERHWRHTINIHHSFLPAFEGARPYHRAHERGVKIIGATAHFATSELDAGPIIEQDITRITHRDGPLDMVRKGRDLERIVLARAVRWYIDDRIIINGNKTILFED